MSFFDSFIITQKTVYMIFGFAVLFLATVINFAFCGLFGKNSQKMSNNLTISTLILATICQIPFIAGFSNPHSLDKVYFFGSNIVLGGLEIFLCIVSQLLVLFVFLISKQHLKQLRFKGHYFNSLYLCTALGLDMLVISKGFLPFLLSLEILSFCMFFVILGFKNRKIYFNSYKFLTFSLFASALMVFACALSGGFSADFHSVTLVISKILFMLALIMKSGFALIFETNSQSNIQSFPSFVFYNSIMSFAYLIAVYKMLNTLFEPGSFMQIFAAILLCTTFILSAFKLLKAQNFKDFIFLLNTLNFCFCTFLFFINDIQVHTGAILFIVNIAILNLGLLGAAAIFDINKNGLRADFDNFSAICHTNPYYCRILSLLLLIACALVPSGIFASRFYINNALAQTGLWSSIVMFIFALAYTILITCCINFAAVFYKKPQSIKDLKEGKYKKRTNLNYSILLMSVIFLITMCAFSAKFANLITGLQ